MIKHSLHLTSNEDDRTASEGGIVWRSASLISGEQFEYIMKRETELHIMKERYILNAKKYFFQSCETKSTILQSLLTDIGVK